MKRRNVDCLMPAGVISLHIGVILWILTWPSGAEPCLPIEPSFETGWRLPTRPVKILTYNFGFGKALDEQIEVIKREDPDIVCLQELLRHQFAIVEKGIGLPGYWQQSTNHGDDPDCGKAIFARGGVQSPQPMPNPLGGAYGVWAAVEINGGRFLAASIHLMDLKSPRAGYPAREREIRALHAAVRKVGAPILFAGDFNNPPISVNYDLITRWFTDLGSDSGPTHATNLPIVRVDYVFGTPEWETVSTKKIKTKLSDHFPIVVVVQPKSRSANAARPE